MAVNTIDKLEFMSFILHISVANLYLMCHSLGANEALEVGLWMMR